ncbi:MAG: gluconate 2-dehydrogenase subunit 3 family protein [Acidobacteria bacterium]|nr:gluconate 2-dehydrogenase subunit 3 family protein [Acidobacteriota bacterium]
MPATEHPTRNPSAAQLSPALFSFRPLVRAIACTIVPEAAALDEKAWANFETLIDAALGDRPPALQRRLQLFLRAIDWLPVVRFGHRFASLQPAQRARFLAGLENHTVQLIRSGFWGLRTLVLLGFYGRPEAAAAIGYKADPRGWEAFR